MFELFEKFIILFFMEFLKLLEHNLKYASLNVT